MAFETLFDASNATVFKFDNKGDELVGYYMGSFDHEGDYGPTKKHIFDTANGAVCVFGQRNLIQTLPTVKPGTMVRLTYTSDLEPKAKGRQPMKLFKFEQDRKNTREVAGVELEATAAADVANYEPIDTSEDDALDTVAPARASRPTIPARTPSAAQQAAVRATLGGAKRTA